MVGVVHADFGVVDVFYDGVFFDCFEVFEYLYVCDSELLCEVSGGVFPCAVFLEELYDLFSSLFGC